MSLKKSLGLISLCALVGAVTYGCSSTTTNSGGGGGDDGGAGSDASTHHDTGTTGGDSGTAMDTGTTGDSAAACAPGNVSSFMPPAYVPAARHAGACTLADITAYYAACLNPPASTQATCMAFTGMKAACSSCIEGPSTAATWPAVIDTPNGIASINLAGCMQLAGGTAGAACAAAAQKSSACADAACSPSCKVTDDASLQLYEACAQQADANGCSTYAMATQSCESAESMTDGGDSVCLTGMNFQDLYNAVVPVFCGP